MKPFTTRLIYGLGSLLAGISVQTVLAEAQPNPYQAIIERNPFGLKPPPPPPDPTPVVPVIPPGKVVLTGITTMFGNPRALFEVTETEPGKPATVRKPILHEGDRDGALEVVSIDVEKSQVKIRNSGIETNITFDIPKLTVAASALPAIGGFPPSPLTTGIPGTPGGFSPANAVNPGRGNPLTYGNSGSVPAPNARAGVPGAYGAPGTGSGLRSIPTRGSPPPVPPLPGVGR